MCLGSTYQEIEIKDETLGDSELERACSPPFGSEDEEANMSGDESVSSPNTLTFFDTLDLAGVLGNANILTDFFSIAEVFGNL